MFRKAFIRRDLYRGLNGKRSPPAATSPEEWHEPTGRMRPAAAAINDLLHKSSQTVKVKAARHVRLRNLILWNGQTVTGRVLINCASCFTDILSLRVTLMQRYNYSRFCADITCTLLHVQLSTSCNVSTGATWRYSHPIIQSQLGLSLTMHPCLSFTHLHGQFSTRAFRIPLPRCFSSRVSFSSVPSSAALCFKLSSGWSVPDPTCPVSGASSTDYCHKFASNSWQIIKSYWNVTKSLGAEWPRGTIFIFRLREDICWELSKPLPTSIFY